jgi:uncharacterized membrane protein
MYVNNSNTLILNQGGNSIGPAITSSSIWYLLAVTINSNQPRFHVHDGTSWSHTNGSATVTADTVAATDQMTFSSGQLAGFFAGNVVCAAAKKANSTDLQIETLSRTAFQAWRDFAFDWLVGFDSTLEAAGVVQDQASPGTGDETSRTSITTVSDPPGWTWAPVAVTPTADFTGTPLSGLAPLSVAFTDTSTGIPTSWAWNFGDGATSTSQNPTHSYTSSGVYTVTLIATNASGSNTKTRTAYISATEAIVYAAGGGIEIY